MINYLANHQIFSALNEEELKVFTSVCKVQKFDKHTVIFSEQQPAHRFFILQKGKVKLHFGSDKTLEVSQGQTFGDWAMLSHTVRLATCSTILDSECIVVDYTNLLDSKKFPAAVALKVVLALTKPIITRLQTTSQTSTEILISHGEGQQVEFKATLRTNLFTNKRDEKIELAAIKTLAGFLNSTGGVLFVGVTDDGNIEGLAADNFETTDKMLLHLGHLIHGKMGKNAATYIHSTPLTIQDKLILRVDCSASPEPVFLNNKNQQYFFVRQGAETLSYNLQETVDYVQSHY